ncbi:MAG: DUF1254 domain-containing protein [Chloroflexota bacterium]|nr:MAG: DUF1254 domain-containing protein [Chloroflexota bacterium]
MSKESEATQKYNTPIPENITTPDVVKTRIGKLKFFDGLPSKKTARKVFDNLDFLRGVEVFLNGIPAASLEALRAGHEQNLGVKACNQVAIMDRLLDSNPLFLTGNTDTVYASLFLDLEKDGPTVVEIPPGCGPGTVNDAFFRFVIDMGAPGPDRGQGGNYLILPPEYDGELPESYFKAQSPSYINWVILRGFLVDGKPDAAVEMFKNGVKVYPLKDKHDPPSMEFVSASEKILNTIHANNYEFYTELDRVIQREPIGLLEPELRGQIAAIGIVKGKPFSPDERMREILTDAVAVGNATARAIVFEAREPETYIYEGRTWTSGFVGGSHEWLKDGGLGGRFLDARTMFFYMATVNTPAMVLKMVGAGSQYALNARDNNGDYLVGDNNYRLNLPAGVPAKDFWSVVIYDPQTRSELQTGQPFPSKNNERDELDTNTDGSVDLYFGPTPPPGKEKNWIETVPGKGWFTILRLYGPLESWFDQSWQPGAIELID